MAKTASGAALGRLAANGLKAMAPSAPAAAKIAVDSKSRGRSNERGRSVTHNISGGVIMSTAVKLPSHLGDQMATNFSQSTCSMRPEAPTPTSTLELTLALIVAVMTAINTNLATRPGVAKALRPPAHQLTRRPPANASNALPAAVATATCVGTDEASFMK